MKLFFVWRVDDGGYDTYSDFVVAAETAEAARLVHPSAGGDTYLWTWTNPDNVEVKEIGTANDGVTGVICASFHAG